MCCVAQRLKRIKKNGGCKILHIAAHCEADKVLLESPGKYFYFIFFCFLCNVSAFFVCAFENCKQKQSRAMMVAKKKKTDLSAKKKQKTENTKQI